MDTSLRVNGLAASAFALSIDLKHKIKSTSVADGYNGLDLNDERNLTFFHAKPADLSPSKFDSIYLGGVSVSSITEHNILVSVVVDFVLSEQVQAKCAKLSVLSALTAGSTVHIL